MKKFKFTLGRMLDYKDQLLTEEKNKLAVVRKRQSDLEQRIDSLENESCRISEEMNRGQKKGIAVFQLVAFQAQRDNIRQQVGQLRQDLSSSCSRSRSRPPLSCSPPRRFPSSKNCRKNSSRLTAKGLPRPKSSLSRSSSPQK